jgi:hypothetical protein
LIGVVDIFEMADVMSKWDQPRQAGDRRDFSDELGGRRVRRVGRRHNDRRLGATITIRQARNDSVVRIATESSIDWCQSLRMVFVPELYRAECALQGTAQPVPWNQYIPVREVRTNVDEHTPHQRRLTAGAQLAG